MLKRWWNEIRYLVGEIVAMFTDHNQFDDWIA